MGTGNKPENLESASVLSQTGTGWLSLYLLAFLLCAAFFQVRSSVPPWKDGSPIEYFTAALLWMLSLSCLQIALEYLSSKRKKLLWLASSAALAILAMDEIFAVHERTRDLTGDDDHIKILLVLMAGVVLFVICRLEKAPAPIVGIIFAGYAVHCLYILEDMGDGDYFRIPLPIHTLWWIEECLEILAMAIYLLGFQALYAYIRKRQRPITAGEGLEEADCSGKGLDHAVPVCSLAMAKAPEEILSLRPPGHDV